MAMATLQKQQQQQRRTYQHHNCAVVVMSDPGNSGLTYNTPTKRARDDVSSIPSQQLPLAAEQIEARQMLSSTTSTSGHTPPSSAISLLQHHNAEIDALVRFQMEKLRAGVEEARKRQCVAILTATEQEVRRRMEEKEAELEVLRRRNADLEEKVRQVAAEGQIWFRVARNSEALVSGLRSSLEQALLMTGATGKEEGFGDSGVEADATSCCYEGGDHQPEQPVLARRRGVCGACALGEACVLVLPCRHLCLCESCEGRVDACPVCLCAKNRTLRVFLS